MLLSLNNNLMICMETQQEEPAGTPFASLHLSRRIPPSLHIQCFLDDGEIVFAFDPSKKQGCPSYIFSTNKKERRDIYPNSTTNLIDPLVIKNEANFLYDSFLEQINSYKEEMSSFFTNKDQFDNLAVFFARVAVEVSVNLK